MTTGTVHSFDARRGTGTVQTATGTVFPFSSKHAALAAGESVSFSLVGGLAGVYALNVEPTTVRARAARHRALAPAPSLSWPFTRTLAAG